MKPRTPASENPFEARWAVLSGARRRCAAPKRARRNVFADRRIGEDDPTLADEDRYLARLQRERTRRTSKRARYALEEDGEGEEGPPEARATHSLLRDDYDEAEALEEARGNEDAAGDESGDEFLTVKPAEEEAPGRERTHQEIMDEVVLKSKMYKAKRQQDKHEADAQTAKLDQELPDIMRLLAQAGDDFAKKKAQENRTVLPKKKASIFEEENDKGDLAHGTVSPPPPNRTAKFSYESVYQQLASEKRARPSDRLLTEEEKAKKELDDLMEMERMRRDRMQNAVESDAEEDEGRRDVASSRRPRQKTNKKNRRAGGDDLEDGFELSASDGDDDSEEDDQAHAPDDEPSASDSDHASDRAEDEEDIDPNGAVVADHAETQSRAKEGVPFVFKHCPASPRELQKLFENRTLSERQLVVERLRKCFAVSLNPPVNATKLDRLLECCLFRIEILSKVSAVNLKRAVAEIDMLLIHAHALGKRNEGLVAGWARDTIANAFHSLTSPRKSGGLSKRWNASDLLVLRSVGRLFPSSDIRHPVSTPLVLLLSEGLAISRMLCCRDVAMGCFVGRLLVEQMAGAGRYSGQLTTFITSVLCGALSPGTPKLRGLFGAYREGDCEADVGSLRLRDLMEADEANADDENSSGGENEQDDGNHLQNMVVESVLCLADAATMSGRVSHQDIVFQKLPLRRLPRGKNCTNLLQALVSSRETRKPLALYTVSAAAAVRKSLNPKFSAESGVFRRVARTSYHAARSGDMSQSAMRVRRALKKEERGWARDVRQSASARRTEQDREDGARRERGDKRAKEAMAFLEAQQATWKKAEKRQRMLSGKKW